MADLAAVAAAMVAGQIMPVALVILLALYQVKAITAVQGQVFQPAAVAARVR
jgi:hypothetical protein